MSLFTELLNFVIYISKKHAIDESHGLSHSMDVLIYARNIYESELPDKPFLREHERIIYIAAILHDMCDKKYMDEKEGVLEIEQFLQERIEPEEIDIIKQIISTMSYSTVKKNGFPELGIYQTAYHIVREADVLAAYNFDRCMVYHMSRVNSDIHESFNAANALFKNRIFKHSEDGLFTTEYSKQISVGMHAEALKRISTWTNVLKTPSFVQTFIYI